MSNYGRFDDDRESREEQRRRYEGDAIYDAWRRGMDTDRIHPDMVSDHYYAGDPPESVADELQRNDARRRQIREQEDIEAMEQQEYYEREHNAYLNQKISQQQAEEIAEAMIQSRIERNEG